MVEQEYSHEHKCQRCGARFCSKIPQIRCFSCRVQELIDVVEEIKRLAILGMEVEYK